MSPYIQCPSCEAWVIDWPRCTACGRLWEIIMNNNSDNNSDMPERGFDPGPDEEENSYPTGPELTD